MRQPPAGTARTLRRSAAVLLCAATLPGLVAIAAGAQTAPGPPADPPPVTTAPPPVTTAAPPPTTEPPAPTTTTTVARERTLQEQAIVDSTIALYEVKAELADVARNLVDVASRLDVAEKALAATVAKLADVRAALAEVRGDLQARAAFVYQRHSDRLGMVLSVDRVVNLSAGNHYADSIAVVDNREIARLQRLVVDLEVQRDQQDVIRRDLTDQRDRLDRGRADLQAEVDRRQTEIDRLGGVPIMGQSVLTGAEIAAWFTSTGQRARLMNDTPIGELTELYVSEGNAENVRGDIAFAQAVLETGSFGHATDNNFAGIGACDSCTSQYLFPTPRDGVRAQIQLLRNYADPFSRAAMLKNPLDATLHGTDPAGAVQKFDTFSFKGRAPVWNVMGAGNWATDPLYAGKVLGIYSRMLTFKASLGA